MKRLLTYLFLVSSLLLINTNSFAGKIRIGTEGAYPPWNAKDASGNLTGFEVELAYELCSIMKHDCTIVEHSWDEMIPGLIGRKYDAIMAGMSITDARMKVINFSMGYADEVASFAVMKGSPLEFLNTLDAVNFYKIDKKEKKTLKILRKSLAGKTVGTQRATIHANFLESGILGPLNIKYYKDYKKINEDLVAGKIDVALHAAVAFLDYANKSGKPVTLMGPTFSGGWFGNGVGVGLRKEDIILLKDFNKAIKVANSTGITQKLAVKWFGFNAAMDYQGLWADIKPTQTQQVVEKKEPKKKEKKKKKKKVVKVVEPEQEEFKPKKKDLDNDPPVIQIAEAITVDSQEYTLEGSVKDKSDSIYLTIDGRPIDVVQNKFKLDRFKIDPETVDKIKIVAIDKWNNRSEKIVKVTVKLKATEVAKTYEELKPNKVKVSKDDNKIAIIIGAEKYKNMSECNYCSRDAKAFKNYASRALGVKSSNIISLFDDEATRGEILRVFKISLPRIAGDGGKDISIFFAGHGLASESGEELYIIPQDGNQSLLEDTAISRVELIKLIKKVEPKSVTMFFDTCYSGETRSEQMLVADLRGIRIVEADGIPDNFTIFTASSSTQGSSHIKEAKHGIFSYYLMKGLEGKADGNKDKQITNGELIAYLKTNVSKEAFTQNREQDPMLSGDPNQVLMRY